MGNRTAPTGYLSRAQVATIYDVSYCYISLKLDSILNPIRINGRVYYEQESVMAHRRTWVRRRVKMKPRKTTIVEKVTRGKWASTCFALFSQGKTLAQIVAETAIDPSIVREFWREYKIGLEQGERLRQAREQEEKDEKELRALRRADAKREWLETKMRIAREEARNEKTASQSRAIAPGTGTARESILDVAQRLVRGSEKRT